MLMGVVMVTSSTIILSKTLRDQHEGAKLHNKIEEARTEKLLVGLKG
jgi:hypothetical protein